MSKLSLDSKKRAKKVCERNRHFLAKESFSPFPQKIEKQCVALAGEITNNDYVCIDEVDIAKPTTKLMQGIHKVRDGSSGSIVSGFMYHGISVKGIPIIMEQEDLYNKFKCEYFVRVIKKAVKYTKGKGIYIFDAAYDIASYFEFLNSKNITYIIRAKKTGGMLILKVRKDSNLKNLKTEFLK